MNTKAFFIAERGGSPLFIRQQGKIQTEGFVIFYALRNIFFSCLSGNEKRNQAHRNRNQHKDEEADIVEYNADKDRQQEYQKNKHQTRLCRFGFCGNHALKNHKDQKQRNHLPIGQNNL